MQRDATEEVLGEVYVPEKGFLFDEGAEDGSVAEGDNSQGDFGDSLNENGAKASTLLGGLGIGAGTALAVGAGVGSNMWDSQGGGIQAQQ